ncbi:hypothetical protein [Chromobacterium sp. IIBBL 290-4]|uniref:hypothetical protein n=2 Tax=unclassified Chromobacterium TaxID=2641838 RepID=UPI0020B82ACD|nr:hypothetical protein [Chromobacterium sp. IIBBL 290-4]UTH74215.1 hypothetical protein NKT35_22190 [Chromobacterium sp. IIBBL 290-4]
MALDDWSWFCCTQGPGRGLFIFGVVMHELFGDVACPKCGKAGGVKVRTSRPVTEKFIEYYLRCKHCQEKMKAVWSFEGSIWPSKLWDEQKIRSEFKPWQVAEHIDEIHKVYIERASEAKANIARLKAELKAAKLEAEKVDQTFDLLLSIGLEYNFSET